LAAINKINTRIKEEVEVIIAITIINLKTINHRASVMLALLVFEAKMSKHLTAKIGVGALIIDKANNTILLSKKSYGTIKAKWTFPEGYVDKGESPAKAIRREVREELNGEIVVNDLVGIRYKKEQRNATVYFIFNCDLVNRNELKLNDEELTAFKFFDIKQAEKDPEIYSLVKIILAKMKSKPEFNFRRVNFLPPELEIDKDDYLLYL
jgi:ADP-ribose pyrophosphatase YjhB (NUDIX family)